MAHTPTRQEWEAVYRAAILETDDSKLIEMIDAAEAVIHLRIESMGGMPPEAEEQALADALSMLRLLRGTRL